MPYIGQKPADIISTAVDTVTGKFSGEVDAASLDISGNIDVDGTTNLDVVDIDGVLTQDGGAVFNEASADVDFRVESNGNANMLVIDGGDDVIAIGAAKDAGATVKIQNKDDGNTNTLDLFNDNGNRTVTMQQDTAGNAKMRFQKNDGTFTTTIDANLGGILFGTDTAAANTLDDYEEGVFSPAVAGTGGGGFALNSDSDTLSYTKIGRQVTITGRLDIASTSSPSGDVKITGLPFVIGDLGDNAGDFSGLINFLDSSASSQTNIVTRAFDTETQINLKQATSAVAQNDSYYMSFSYFTTA